MFFKVLCCIYTFTINYDYWRKKLAIVSVDIVFCLGLVSCFGSRIQVLFTFQSNFIPVRAVQFSGSGLVVIGIVLSYYYIMYLYLHYYTILLYIYMVYDIVLLCYILLIILNCYYFTSYYIMLLLDYVNISVCIVFVLYQYICISICMLLCLCLYYYN